METYTIDDELIDYWNDYVEAFNASKKYSQELNITIVKACDDKNLTFRHIGRLLGLKHNSIADRYYRTKVKILDGRLEEEYERSRIKR